MKTFTALCLSALACASSACVDTSHALHGIPATATANRLPVLEASAEMGPLHLSEGITHADLLRLFKAEVEHNITSGEGSDASSYGWARLEVTEALTGRTGRALQIVQLCTLLVPSIFGLPLESYETAVKVRMQILDAQGELVGEYQGEGRAKVWVALYYGYSQHKAPGLADAVALRLALAQIRPQLDTAAGRLRPLLLARGLQASPGTTGLVADTTAKP